jgi:NAD+ synthase
MTTPTISSDALKIDAARVVDEIAAVIEDVVLRRLHKKGAVVGLSGGIDSSVVAALCVHALGPTRVLGLLMPERESSGDSAELGRLLADHLGIRAELEDITAILEGAGCYQRRDDAIRRVVPSYGPGWKSKITLPSVVDGDQYRIFSVVAESPEGERVEARLTAAAYPELIAAMNFKQRSRKMMEYYHADRMNYAVTGTPNRLEYDQGFFVKHGDGAADLKPIAHLYKTQVYQLAEYLGIPDTIRRRPPTTDTYSLPQTQEEFYFSLPYQTMDLCLYGHNHGIPAAALGATLGLAAEQVERVYRDIEAKRRATRSLHLPPQLVAEVAEISGSERVPAA